MLARVASEVLFPGEVSSVVSSLPYVGWSAVHF